ncbi:ABC transporter permease [uncultured Clostridium sp.]|uniref:ABC transporter permease n=1 Tax=uncultured Clostridium sp. TaxID=59620 RepID=UPI0028ED28EE|nr:ABC transporter permease [uncultured Clostridium sp.]
METINILWRNIKWRFENPISIMLTIIQPLIWLLLYGAIAEQSMQNLSGGNYTAFILPGIMMLVTLACCSSGGYLNFIMKSKGSFYRMLIAPVSRSSIVLGQMLEAVLLSLVEVSILLVVSMFLSVRIGTGFTGVLLIIVLIFISAFFMSGLSYAISLRLPNEVIYETIMNLIVLSIFFTSTALFSVDNMSGGLKIAVIINPFTQVINCIRSLVLGSTIEWHYLLFVIGLFLLLCCGSFTLAIRRLKREMIQ